MADHDMDANVYSPDGQVFQIDYACKAVDALGTAVGVCCVDGVVLGVEKLMASRMLEEGANTRVQAIDRHVGCVVGGMLPDGRHLVGRAREEANSFRSSYGIPITGDMLATRVSRYNHFFTISWYRPFGAALLMASYGDDGPQLHLADPSGEKKSFHGCAVGKAKTIAKTDLEKIDFKTITCKQAVEEIAKILYSVHDDQRDKIYEMELAWVTEENGRRFQKVPKDIAEPALAKGKEEAEKRPKD
eukprot:TRINITY_DN24613_c0_g1_i1.p1 TRINITY_DN24613_c0_g1~~TRINITY_DN24613_c0_g1_i1.p1  ORF type:complete len:263 (+),score=117.11 TRINITY_DN24613_c0_g1_i1:56-790(+)